MPEDDGSGSEEPAPQHSPFLLFLLVLVFFITGLVGILICHVLKEKGYRCRTAGKEKDPEVKKLPSQDDSEDMNDDTVEQIVKCIIHNEANLEALKEMLVEQQGKEPAVSRISPVQGKLRSVPSHHHTVHLGSAQAPCMHCIKRKKRSAQQRCRTRESRGHIHPGETTVFSVGRFRVTHIGKKSSIPEQDHVPSCSGNVEEVGTMHQSNTCGESSLTDISNSLQGDTLKDERVSNGTLQMESYKNGTGTWSVSKEDVEYKATEGTEGTVLKASATKDRILSGLSSEDGETLMNVKETNHTNLTLSESHGNVIVLTPSWVKVQDDLCKDRTMQTATETKGNILHSTIEMEQILVAQDDRIQKEDENEESRKL